jgi:hydrogenase maturation protease
MTPDDRKDVLVVGIGNPDRGDDGVGPAIAARLRERAPKGVCVIQCRGDMLALLDRWSGYDAVILIDAAAPDGEPGRIRLLDFASEALPVGLSRGSTHALDFGAAVELARSLGRLPGRLIAYVVEGEGFAIGAPLSPMVAAAVEPVTDRILGVISSLTREAISNA